MSADDKKVHPMRRKHRRGKRAGKKHRPTVQLAPEIITAPSPVLVSSLRSRLSLLAKAHG